MTRYSPPQVAFNSGEIDPLLFRRFDFKKFQTGLAASNGFLPLKQGGFTRAPGSLMRGTTLNNAKARRVPFEFARNDALTLEFTDGKMRVWRYGALVQSGGSPYELDTPFPESSLELLQWVQSADRIYITDGLRPIQRLSRYALDNWTIEDWVLTTGPFRVQNLDTTITIGLSSATGTTALMASADVFQAGHVGGLMQFKPLDIDIPIWTGNTAVTVGDLMIYDDNIYSVAAGTNTGVNPPIHTEGTRKYDSTNGISWTFLSDLVGVVRITAVADAQHATATVLKRIPRPCVTSASYRWSEGAWSELYGYPAALELYDQRMVAAATETDPRTIWFSGIGDYSDWEPGTDADSSFAYAISGDSSINRILNLKRSALGLAVFCLGEENVSAKIVAGANSGTAIGPTNAQFLQGSTIGSNGGRPIAPHGNPVFISKDEGRVFEIAYDLSTDRNLASELSLPSQHLGAARFKEAIYQASPLGLVYFRRGDGTLAIMLQDKAQDVLGWAPLSVAGGFVESFDVTPNSDGTGDVVTLVVQRTINGVTVRCVEELALVYGVLTGAEPISEAVHLYSALSFASAEATDTFSVPHLIGQQVYAWTDEGTFGPYTVAEDGGVTLGAAVSKALIGLFDDTHYAELLDIQVPANDGNTMGRRKRMHTGAGIGVHRTADGTVQRIERELGQADRIGPEIALIPRAVASVPTVAYSGVGKLDVPSGEALEMALRFRPKGGAPMTITGIVTVTEEAGR